MLSVTTYKLSTVNHIVNEFNSMAINSVFNKDYDTSKILHFLVNLTRSFTGSLSSVVDPSTSE
jgi:hypothetical protein